MSSPPSLTAQLEGLKEKGNVHFRAKELALAASSFREGVTLIEESSKDMKDLSVDVKTIYLQLSTNLALCLLNQNLFDETIIVCESVLTIDKDNSKALYRRALANKSKAERQIEQTATSLIARDKFYTLARADLEKLHQLDISNKPVKQELSNVVKEAVKAKIALKTVDPAAFAAKNKPSKASEEAADESDEEEEVPINKNKKAPAANDLRTHDQYKITQNFTIEQLNEVSKNAFEIVSTQLLSREAPPISSFQFEQEFDTLKKKLDKLAMYLLRLPSKIFAEKLFTKKGFQPHHLLTIISSFTQHAIKDNNQRLVELFTDLKNTYKFNLCLMQITKEEKKVIRALFDTFNADEQLLKAYKLV